ncbi:uncharacterized protein LOC112178325 [Rosa chinensis]|uniref:uncharacterized protein LOC112178325 n=1 Tax=Rosa chinensis TaxID=74649 RepID=UPI000D08C70C|nr:uncharacterized protein LOC112178325 [Rosa chinensis]
MKVLAWNCRGLNNSASLQALKLLIQQQKPSIIFLSETKVDDWNYLNDLRLQIGYLNCEAVFSEGQSGGVALFWGDELDNRFRSKSRNHVDVEVRETDGSGIAWRLTGLYGHPSTADRYRTWDLLRSLSAECALPWVVVGDMNELLHAYEKERGAVRREGQMQPFRDCLSECDLYDLGFQGQPFTWSGPGMRSRLDRAVATATWMDVFTAARVVHLPPVHGDHIPILLGVHRGNLPTVERRQFQFRFESFWTLHVDCQDVVRQGWEMTAEGLPMLQVKKKLMQTRFSLNQWQRVTFRARSREFGYIRDRLQILYLPMTQDSMKGMEEVVLRYFTRLFKANDINYIHMQSVVELVQPKVTAEMNADLCAPYSAAEIKTALFQMYPTKAPGPDGMPPLFFQKYWEIVGSDVVSAVQLFLHTGQFLGEINYTHICLIPKVKDPVSVSDLRPIALCNVLYKICSKVIANRLKKILSHIISPFQSAFIPGRLITDNTLVANEVSHFIHNCYSSSEGVFSLKLDMSKAYDRMEWSFLEAVLYRLGFDENWIGVIMKCVTTVRYSFLINGQPRGYLTPTRGLRQGDPLSPYLFLLCAEVFSALLARKVTHGELQGIKICEGAPIIHHLLFADDSLLFGKATLSEYQHIQSVLNAYELASGQQINFAKSSIVFSKRVPEADKLSLASFLGVAIEVKHEKYLGLPTYLGRNWTETFAYIKERLSKKLAGWQGKLLSGAGKDLLVRVVAQALPSYAMSCFLLPNNFCDDLHQMCAKFWWGSKPNERKIHWMSWERLCRSKEEGGMGFRDLHAHNLALLAKQGWRLIRYPGSLVSRLFKARYFPHSSFLNATTPTHASACWRGIFAAKSVLQAGLRWQVGNGTSIRIWDDPWIPRPNLFRPIRYGPSPLVLVSDLMVDGHWNKELISENFHADEALLICSIPLSRSIVPDRLIWHFDMNGLFTTKSAYKIAFASLHLVLISGSSSNSNPSHWKFIWAAPIPGKVKVHVWKVCASILPTASQLRSRRVPVEDGCLFCNSEEETLSHVSRECCFTRDVIGLAPDLLLVLHTPPSSLLDWLALCYTLVTPRAFAFLLMLLWGVWKERNQRLWVGKGRTVQQVFCHTTSILHSYVVARHSVTPRLGRQVKPWSITPAGWLKVNIDGAFDQGTRRGGLGIVVRDADSTVVAGACGQCSDVLQPLVVEALASRLACKLVEENSLAPVIF